MRGAEGLGNTPQPLFASVHCGCMSVKALLRKKRFSYFVWLCVRWSLWVGWLEDREGMVHAAPGTSLATEVPSSPATARGGWGPF